MIPFIFDLRHGASGFGRAGCDSQVASISRGVGRLPGTVDMPTDDSTAVKLIDPSQGIEITSQK